MEYMNNFLHRKTYRTCAVLISGAAMVMAATVVNENSDNNIAKNETVNRQAVSSHKDISDSDEDVVPGYLSLDRLYLGTVEKEQQDKPQIEPVMIPQAGTPKYMWLVEETAEKANISQIAEQVTAANTAIAENLRSAETSESIQSAENAAETSEGIQSAENAAETSESIQSEENTAEKSESIQSEENTTEASESIQSEENAAENTNKVQESNNTAAENDNLQNAENTTEKVEASQTEKHMEDNSENNENGEAEELTAVFGSVIKVNSEEYESLQRIVEAEAGNQDEIGRILVANVVLNRVKSELYPDNIVDNIFRHSGDVYQFEPVKNGAYYSVTVSEKTKECVDRALAGEDYSKGALYFTRKTSDSSWFNTSLTFLFIHGAHYFYK